MQGAARLRLTLTPNPNPNPSPNPSPSPNLNQALLGYEPEQLTEEKLPSCVHPDDLRGLRDMLEAKKQATSPRADGEARPTLSQRNANAAAGDVAGLLVSLRFRAHDNSYVTLELPMHMVLDQSGEP